MGSIVGNLVARFVRRSGRHTFQIDLHASTYDIANVIFVRLLSLARFQIKRPWLKSSGFFNFAEPAVSIRAGKHVSIGSGCFFGRGLEIDALSLDGVIIGNNVTIKSGGIINCTGILAEFGQGLIIEDNVGISERCYIQVRGPVRIGKGAILGPNVSIFSENHNFDDENIDIRLQGVTRKGVILGSGCWIGGGATITDGVCIGKNSVVAAGAVVTADVPDGAVVGGIPARRLDRNKDLK
ncbi:acyltransferase [Nostoc sp. CHAB 5824]|nr:acyltransferase [Nostoc sp. CHAB 5824]